MSQSVVTAGKFECPHNFVEVAIKNQEELCKEDVENDDNEIWLIQTPFEMDVSSLDSRSISLNSRTVFNGENRLQEEKCHEISASKIMPDNLLNYQLILPSKKRNKLRPVSVPFMGFLHVTETLELPTELNMKIVNKSIATFNDLRQRFVPFGSDEPLPSLIRDKDKKKKKKKKEKDRASKDAGDFSTKKLNFGCNLIEERAINFPLYEPGPSETKSENSLEQNVKKSSKKKSKNKEFDIFSQNSTVLSGSNSFNLDCDEICWHPEDKEKKRNSKEIKEEKHDTDLFESPQKSELHNHKKHKKRKRSEILDNDQITVKNELNSSEFSSPIDNDMVVHPSKKPKIEIDSGEITSDSSSNTKKKKKKHKKDKI